MSDPNFDHIGKCEDKVIEECSELIKAICKAKRFGLYQINPYKNTRVTNRTKIFLEMADVKKAIDNYGKELALPIGDKALSADKEPCPDAYVEGGVVHNCSCGECF